MNFNDELLDAYQSLQEDYKDLANKYAILLAEHVQLQKKYIKSLNKLIDAHNFEYGYRKDFN